MADEYTIHKLKRLLDDVGTLRGRGPEYSKFIAWRNKVEAVLVRDFGRNSIEFRQFRELTFGRIDRTGVLIDVEYVDYHEYDRDLDVLKWSILNYISDLQDRFQESRLAIPTNVDTVFIVHGHDRGLASDVARVVESRKLTAIILDERPSEGRTIIEKLEHHGAPCAFAIALFTPDDEGRAHCDETTLRPRARQNVVLELGYFMGAIGRKRVAMIFDETVEIPSDCQGIVYIATTSDWKSRLHNELDAIGIGTNPAIETKRAII